MSHTIYLDLELKMLPTTLLATALLLPLPLRVQIPQRSTVVLSEALTTDEDKAIYALGHNIASQIPQLKGLSEAEVDTFVSGIRANLADEKAAVDLSLYVPMASALLQGREQDIAKKAASRGARALAAAAKESGAVKTPGGAVLLTEREGSGAKPGEDDTVEVHYEGRLVDGSIFDSSHARGRPATFKPSKVVPGWTLALQMMRPGDKWQLFLPPSLGYGEAGMPPRIPPSAVLIFELELLSVSEEAPMTFLQTVAYGILTLAFGYAGPDPLAVAVAVNS